MNKKFFLPAVAALALLATSPGFTQGSVGAAASAEVVRMQNAPPPARLAADQQAGAVLQRFAAQRGFRIGWDEARSRMVVVTSAAAKLPASDADFLDVRESLAVEATLRSRADIIEAFATQASAVNIVSVPGNPIARQLAEEKKKYDLAMASYNRMRDQARRDAVALIAAADKALASELEGPTWDDRWQRLLDAVITQHDASYRAGQLGEEKKRRLDELRLRRDKAIAEYEQAEKARQAMEQKLSALRGTVKQEQASKMETIASMPLFGATVLAQTESFDALRDDYEIAVMVAWSPKLEKEARDILLGKGTAEPRPDAKSLGEWLEDQDLSVMVGPRRYLAADGSTNYLGISAIDFDPDDPGAKADRLEEAKLWAKQAALLSLFGETESVKKAERLRQSYVGADGQTREKIFKDFSMDLRQGFSDFVVRGLEIVKIQETQHPASGRSILVVVANVNSTLAVRAGDLMKDTYATLRELNADQAFKVGEKQGMEASAAETRNSAQMRAAGRAEGARAVSGEAARRQAAPSNRASVVPADPAAAAPQRTGRPQTGAWMGGTAPKDDF
jgi:hypothetical protein